MELQGITWDHPRGYSGLRAVTTQIEKTMRGVRVQWHTHSLADFSGASIEKSAEQYDLVIYDHPFVGDVWSNNILIDLSRYLDGEFIEELKSDVVGRGVDLFTYKGGLWGLPLDAACQVAAFRSDLCIKAGLSESALRQASIDEIIKQIARAGCQLAISYNGVGSIMTFFTLCYEMGAPPFLSEDCVVPVSVGRQAIRTMRKILEASPPEVLDWDSIACLENMAHRDDLAYCPYIFGFSAYSTDIYGNSKGRRPIEFTASPALKGSVHTGGIIGGAGLGVSSRCKHPETATAFVKQLMSQHIQLEMALNLAQPGRRSTWEDDEVNKFTRNFYRNTVETIENGYIRPREAEFVSLQDAAGECLERHLRRETDCDEILTDFEEIFAR